MPTSANSARKSSDRLAAENPGNQRRSCRQLQPGRAARGHGELAAIGLALLIPTAWFIVRRQRRKFAHVAPRARNALSACRIGVLLLLVMVLGAPYLHTDETLDLKPVVALVVDDSASMNLPAGPYDPVEARALAKVADTQRPAASNATAAANTPPQNSASDDAADLAWPSG